MIVQIGLLDKVHNSGNGARSTRVPDEEEKKIHSEAGCISDGIGRKEAFQECQKLMVGRGRRVKE